MSDEKEKFKKWHKDPANWVFDIFYFNKEDKRLFPPKRLKPMGWTINFANHISIFIFILLVAAVLFIARFV